MDHPTHPAVPAPPAPLTVVYRWRVRPGAEAQFVDGWERVTRAIHARCGSHGSRLHRSPDGPWLAYARWPDRATREACDHGEVEGVRLMQASGELVEELVLDEVLDLLDDRPSGCPPAGHP